MISDEYIIKNDMLYHKAMCQIVTFEALVVSVVLIAAVLTDMHGKEGYVGTTKCLKR